ncbi:hypothetical protein ACSTJQ_12580 [Vibrio parahaemolyticus]
MKTSKLVINFAIIFSSSISYASTDTHLDSVTLPVEQVLKSRHDDSELGYVQTGPLLSDQGNIATDNQDVTITLPTDAAFSVQIEGKVVSPGSSQTFAIPADESGNVKFGVLPKHILRDGKVKFGIAVDVKSNLDRFWETADPVVGDWVDTGEDKNYSDWSPVAGNQMANFTQTRTHYDLMTRSIQNREYEPNLDEYRDVGEHVNETQLEEATDSRYVIAASSEWTPSGDITDCSDWSPDPSSIQSGTAFEQTQTCSQDKSRTWTYTTGGDVIHEHDQLIAGEVINKRQATGSKVSAVWVRSSTLYPFDCGTLSNSSTTIKVKSLSSMPANGSSCDPSVNAKKYVHGEDAMGGNSYCTVTQVICTSQ